MQITRTGRVGAIVIVIGLAVCGGWSLWSETRTCVPVSLPISLKSGHVRTQEFKVNLKAFYIIEIEADRKIPYKTLNCLLGVENIYPDRCKDTPSVVNVSWVLSSQGAVVALGSTLDSKGGSWTNDTIARQLGSFQSERGRRYTLDLNVLADGSSLDAGNPRLKIGVHPMYYEEAAFASIPVLLLTAVLIVIGTIMLVASTLRANRRSKQVASTL
jgi:hypothetical protein